MVKKLTTAQDNIIKLTGKNVLKACPGSGKTYVISHKVVAELRRWKYKNSGMAVLSFTNVAKDELINNIKKITGQTGLPYPHFIGTLDSFISQYIIMPFGNCIFKSDVSPTIVEGDYYETIMSGFWIRECYGNYCELKDFYITPSGKVCDEKEKLTKCTLQGKKPCEKAKETLLKSSILSCKEATLFAIEILKNNPNVLKLIASRFPYFIVDEAQDTSKEQMELLNLIFDSGVTNAILIGDPDQAIYEWRDADPSVFLNMYNEEKWNSVELNENFRCSQHICNATKAFSSLSKISDAVGDSKEFHLKPIIVRYKAEERTHLVEEYLEFVSSLGIDITPENVAVLNRGRTAISGKDYSKIDDLWQNEKTYFLAQATHAKGMKDTSYLYRHVERLLYYLIFQKYDRLDRELINKNFDVKTWKKMIFDLSVRLPNSDISLKDWKIQIEQTLTDFSQANNIEFKVNEVIKTKMRVKDDKLKDFIDQPIKNFFAGSSEEHYTNSTIHSVKGCTFEAVMLIVSSSGKLTENMINTKPIDSEEIRTFYVAATRARKLFVLALPDKKKASMDTLRLPKDLWDYKDSLM